MNPTYCQFKYGETKVTCGKVLTEAEIKFCDSHDSPMLCYGHQKQREKVLENYRRVYWEDKKKEKEVANLIY